MKADILTIDGKRIKEIELPSVFSSKIREDIMKKVAEVEKNMQPYSPNFMAGRKYSASGRVRHIRHKWRTAYGRGISRVPRKIMWRRGTQFFWIGAEVSGTRGGRRAHGPKVEKFYRNKKINKKEYSLAINSAFASTISKDYLKQRYKLLKDKKINIEMPIIIESSSLKLKTKEFFSGIEKMLGDCYNVAVKNKKIRAGKGKLRGRKYKENAGMLLVIGNNENAKYNKIEIKRINDIEVGDFWPLGRLTVYTENAIEDIKNLKKEKIGGRNDN